MPHSRYIFLIGGAVHHGVLDHGVFNHGVFNHGRRLIGQFFRTGEVTEVSPVAARMRRITVTAPGLDWVPGQQVRVCVGDVRTPGSWLDGLRRTYSVWDYDRTRMLLCVLDHGDGPGARWARSLRPGDEVLFSPPEGPMVVRPAPYHLFAGEETAAVAFTPMIRALGPAADWRAVIEVDGPGSRLPMPAGVTWCYRGGAPAASSAALVAAVARLDLPEEPGSAYVAGEARTTAAVVAHLVRDRGWPRRAIRSKPFWTPGRTGLD
jgi:NADPH-dependent ferric siderophore reductase